MKRTLAAMATKMTVLLIDDLDPALEATDTIRFALDNTHYEIDLSDEHINELRSIFARYIDRARKVGGRRGGTGPSPRSSSNRRNDLSQVRRWAADNGVERSTRGRIAGGVLAAYDAKDARALRAATGTPEPSAKPSPKPARRRRAKAATVTAKAK
jgi:hypothetical protein